MEIKDLNIEIKEDLKERVLSFIEGQEGYDSNEVEEVTVMIKKDACIILYGENVDKGISGVGFSAEDAFDNFIINWRSNNGFQGIKNKNIL